MKSWSAQNLIPDDSRDPPPDQQGRASWYAQGVSDALGDRLLMFDNSGGPALELLRFSWKIVAFPGFEDALRERVDLLSQFRHTSFSKVRAVEKLEPKNDLTLVSNHVSGKRLSDELAALRGPAFAMWFIRELVPALVALQQYARGVAHGALTADRIALTAEGRLVIAEHVLGSALDRLQLSREEMWARFGIAGPPTASAIVTLDCQTDVFQLGLVALSVLLGRAIAPAEYPDRLGEVIDRFQQSTGRQLPSSLRSWLTRALHLEGKPFESARDAQNGLGELDAAPASVALLGSAAVLASAGLPSDGMLGVAPRATNRSEPAFRPTPEVLNPQSYLPETESPVARPLWTSPSEAEELGEAPFIPEGRLNRAETDDPPRTNKRYGEAWQREIVAADLLNERRLEVSERYPHGRIGPAAWAIAGLSLLAVVQAAYIGYLLYAPVPAVVVQAPQPAALSVPQPIDFQALNAEPPAKPVEPVTNVAAAVRSGGVRLLSKIEMQLVDGDRVLGSTADGPIVTTAGRHEFELVNNALGYRARQVVNIKPGEILSVTVPHPEGRISINAVPWADIWIDRVHIGETPLANLAVPIGQHEVSFRHPSFGEQRKTTIVRFDVPTLLSADLR